MRLGDTIAAALTFLRADADMQGISGWTLSTDLVGWDEVALWATLQRIPGGQPDAVPVLHHRIVRAQLDVYGPDMESTQELGEQVLDSLYKINSVGYRSSFGAAVVDVAIDMDLGWLPDPQTLKPRWTALLSFGCVPVPVP